MIFNNKKCVLISFDCDFCCMTNYDSTSYGYRYKMRSTPYVVTENNYEDIKTL